MAFISIRALLCLHSVLAFPWLNTECYKPITPESRAIMGGVPKLSNLNNITLIKDGVAVSVFSPGDTYKVRVQLVVPSMVIVTVDNGEITTAPRDLVSACDNHKWSTRKKEDNVTDSPRVTQFELTWEAPELSTEATFNVASAPFFGQVWVTQHKIATKLPQSPTTRLPSEDTDTESKNESSENSSTITTLKASTSTATSSNSTTANATTVTTTATPTTTTTSVQKPDNPEEFKPVGYHCATLSASEVSLRLCWKLVERRKLQSNNESINRHDDAEGEERRKGDREDGEESKEREKEEGEEGGDETEKTNDGTTEGINKDNESNVFHFIVHTPKNVGWLGMGFPETPGEMIRSVSVISWQEEISSPVGVYLLASLDGKENAQSEIKPQPNFIRDISATHTDQMKQIEFTLEPLELFGFLGVKADLVRVPIIWAASSKSGNNKKIPFHNLAQSYSTFNLLSGEEEEEEDEWALVIFGLPIAVLAVLTSIVSRIGGSLKNYLYFNIPILPKGNATECLNPLISLSIGQIIAVVVFMVSLLVFGIFMTVETELTIGTGWASTVSLTVLTTPINKRSIWLYLLRVPYERAVWAHRFMGRVFVVCVLIHFLVIIAEFGVDIIQTEGPFGFDEEVVAMWGLVSGSCAIALALSSLRIIRRMFFEVFKCLHFVLAFFIFVFAMLHNSDDAHRFCLCLPLILTGIDYVWTCSVVCKRRTVRSVRVVGDIIQIEVDRNDLFFEPGQYCWIRIPEISRFQWHPYSISSSPKSLTHSNAQATTLTFHIKSMGASTWSGRLVKKFRVDNGDEMDVFSDRERLVPHLRNSDDDTPPTLSLDLDGAYGLLTMPPQKYKVAIMIGGGIGVTPLISVLSNLLADSPAPGEIGNLTSIKFVYTSQFRNNQSHFEPVLKLASAHPAFEVMRYITKSHQGDAYSHEDMAGDNTFEYRRPNIKQIFKDTLAQNKAKDIAVYVCGPPTLIDEVTFQCTTNKIAIHTETFLL